MICGKSRKRCRKRVPVQSWPRQRPRSGASGLSAVIVRKGALRACEYTAPTIVQANISDEYAPLKAAKQLRRGKRISEIEVIYGKPAAEVAQLGGDVTEAEEPIPELSREFFESAFFRRFQVQRTS